MRNREIQKSRMAERQAKMKEKGRGKGRGARRVRNVRASRGEGRAGASRAQQQHVGRATTRDRPGG
jgi:hypothetical protein